MEPRSELESPGAAQAAPVVSALTPPRSAQLFLLYVIVQTIAGFLVAMLGAAVFVALTPVRGPGFDEQLSRAIALPAVGGSIVFGALAVYLVVARWLTRAGAWVAMGLTHARPHHYAYAIAAGLALGLLHAHGVLALFPAPANVANGAFVGAWREGGATLAVLVVITLAVAPVAEEIVFRGALLAGFRSRWNLGPSAAMVTVLFLAVHMIDILTHPASGISLALLALATLAARVITGSLGPAMALHAAYNLVIVVIVYPAFAR